MISLLHPTRSRLAMSQLTCRDWLEKAGTAQIQLIISTDYDDPQKNLYDENFVRLSASGYNVKGIRSANKSAIDAINQAAKAADGDILIVVSDDTHCPDFWAADLLKHLEGKSDFVAKCPDGIQDWIITMPVMDRKYYNRFGYIYHPDYQHMFCDLELACVGDLLGKTINVPLLFPHDHYSTGRNKKDALNEKADATWKQGEDVFLRRIKNNFDLPADQIVGKITNEGYRAWIQTKVK